MFNKVIAAEAETKKRKAKGGNRVRKRHSKATEILSDEFEDDILNEIEVMNDIPDSIDS
jgi:ribosomal protein S25